MIFVQQWFETRPWQFRYGLAVASVLLSLLMQQFFVQPDFASSLVFFFPSVLLSTWYGGVLPSFLATVTSGILAILLFSPMPMSLQSKVEPELTLWLFFVTAGICTSLINYQLMRNRKETKFSPDGVDIDQQLKPHNNTLQYSINELVEIRSALDQVAIVAITDTEGVIQSVNDRFCQISQYSREELIGQTHRIINSGFHSKAFFQTFWATIASGQVWQGEMQNRAKDGSTYWVDTTVVPLLDDEGKIFQYLAIRSDITQRKQAELELQNLNDRLENLVEERTARLQQSLGFEATLKRITDKVRDSLDESQILQTAVAELAEGLGANACQAALYNMDAGTSQICYEYNPSIFSTRGQVSQMAELPEIYQTLLRGEYLQFCNLERHPIRGRVTMLACAMFDDQDVLGDLWLFIDKEYAFRDLEIRLVQQVANHCAIALRQARLYQSVQAQVRVLEQVNWLKDDFLSTVSHELRTPVSNMKMSIHMLELVLQRQQTEDAADQRGLQKANQYLQILKYECEREITLINDLLDLQRLEAGQRSLNLETVQVKPWLEQIVQPFEARARDRQLHLRFDLPLQELPPFVADLPALERILSELLNNACKYTPPGQDITIRANATPGMMQFAICNAGVEIPADELPRIFDKFYRVPNADPWKQGGTGLGLALVQRLVHHLGGTIQATSSAQQTEFSIEIPNHLVRDPVEGRICNTT
ncbi:MAG: ATP-binding protein [Leptolyngbyaceae cyanobacterium bins.349]|nr:ATP-binding protein [Leptolyngbyaceae cyanobacterium bins.349]